MKNKEFIPYFRLKLDELEEEAVLRVLKSTWLTTGIENKFFEEEFSKIISAKSMSVNSATSGLHLALESINIKQNDKVLLPSYTFTSSAEVVRYLGADPIFVDIKEGTYHLDFENLEDLIKKDKKIKAIMPVNIGGYSMFIKEINEIAKKYSIKVVEDAAHSFPARNENGDFDGTLSDYGVYSFYATKNITTGEGGMITCKDENALKRMKVMRLHGISKDVFNRYLTEDKEAWKYDVIAPGYKYNLTDIAAALGRAQLKKADFYMQKRRDIAKKYTEAFIDKDYLKVPVGYEFALKGSDKHSWHLYSLRLKENRLKITRDEFIVKLNRDYNIGLSMHFIPVHTFSYYKNRYSLKKEDLPITYKTYLQTVSLPIFPSLNDNEIHRIINGVIDLCEKNLK